MYMQSRTDLALEEHEYMVSQHAAEKKQTHIHGVEILDEQFPSDQISISTVNITTKNAAKALNKPMGTYITMEAPLLDIPDDGYHLEISMHISRQLRKLIPDLTNDKSILVIGLGNRAVTADSLGPLCIDHLNITRHLLLEYGSAAFDHQYQHTVSSLSPGVLAQNGIETAEIVKGVVEQTHPDCLIAIDALAARSLHRLNRTIQISNTGIHPGSGVGNHRCALTKEALGVDVIAIGIPTVVDAATIVMDTLEDYTQKTKHSLNLRLFMEDYDSTLFHELQNMYVAGKDIDSIILNMSYTLSEALNITFGKN